MSDQTVHQVPKQMQPAFERITSLTDEFCTRHLDETHAVLCRKMAAALGRKRPPPIGRGRPEGWACGIVLAVGSQNFLFDETTEPYVRAADIAVYFGVALSSGNSLARSLLLRRPRGGTRRGYRSGPDGVPAGTEEADLCE